MATQRMSHLHQRLLQWLLADHQRTRGVTARSHYELVKALGGDKGNIRQSLHVYLSARPVRRSFQGGIQSVISALV
jgi:hypothetical protein